jgi:phosphomevalonate kinase
LFFGCFCEKITINQFVIKLFATDNNQNCFFLKKAKNNLLYIQYQIIFDGKTTKKQFESSNCFVVEKIG